MRPHRLRRETAGENRAPARNWFLTRRRRDLEAPVEPVDEELPRGIRLAGAWSWRLLVIGAVIAVVIFLVIQLRLIVIPLLIAVLISALLVPFVDLLVRHKMAALAGDRHGDARADRRRRRAALSGDLAGDARRLGAEQAVGRRVQRLPFMAHHRPAGAVGGPDHGCSRPAREVAPAGQPGLHHRGRCPSDRRSGTCSPACCSPSSATLFILIDGKSIWNWIVRLFPRGRASGRRRRRSGRLDHPHATS